MATTVRTVRIWLVGVPSGWYGGQRWFHWGLTERSARHPDAYSLSLKMAKALADDLPKPREARAYDLTVRPVPARRTRT